MNSRTKFQGKVVTVFFAVLAVTAGLALNACDSTYNKEMSGSTTSGATTKMSDSDLEKSIKAKLDTDAQLKAANISVSASADRNEATISGTVETQALRSKAVELVKSTHAALILTDKIEVKPRELTRAEWTEDKASEARTKAKAYGESVGNTLDDAWIHTKIVTKLIGNSATPERKINVDVNNNMVTLRGTVETMEEKNEAERVAKATEGVKRVTNQLKISAVKMASPSPRATK
jgi:hyperosmotically inducible periplasmic protein